MFLPLALDCWTRLIQRHCLRNLPDVHVISSEMMEALILRFFRRFQPFPGAAHVHTRGPFTYGTPSQDTPEPGYASARVRKQILKEQNLLQKEVCSNRTRKHILIMTESLVV